MNKHLNLYYTRDTLETFVDIHNDVIHILKKQGNFNGATPAEWDMRVESISSSI